LQVVLFNLTEQKYTWKKDLGNCGTNISGILPDPSAKDNLLAYDDAVVSAISKKKVCFLFYTYEE